MHEGNATPNKVPSSSGLLASVEKVPDSSRSSKLCVPPELDLPSSQVESFRHVRYPAPSRHTTMPPETELPGTPPLDGLHGYLPTPSPSHQASGATNGGPPSLVREQSRAEDRPRRMLAAAVVRRCVRCYLARQERARLTSANGRPARVRVTGVTNLEMLCDFRDVMSMYCNIRILKKPYGPFMFQFLSSKCSHVNLPTWEDDFLVPSISTRCAIVVTLIGVSTSGRLRFLGQSVASLETGWEKTTTEVAAPLNKWTFPVDETLTGLNRFVKGSVHCVVTPVADHNTCLSGQFHMAPVVAPQRSSSFFGWTKTKLNPASLASPQVNAPPETPTSMRKEMVTRWGMLTDTHLHLFDHSSAKLSASLELSKLQLIKTPPLAKTARCRREPGRLYPLKIYCSGSMYTFFVSTYAQQLAWEYKIDLHRRALLIP